MKSVTRFLCETCGSEYKTQEQATKCEGKHSEIIGYTPVFLTDASLPTEIKLSYKVAKSGKRNTVKYRRSYY